MSGDDKKLLDARLLRRQQDMLEKWDVANRYQRLGISSRNRTDPASDSGGQDKTLFNGHHRTPPERQIALLHPGTKRRKRLLAVCIRSTRYSNAWCRRSALP